MSFSYLVKKKAYITRKEGNVGQIVFNVSVLFSLVGKTVTFQVRNDKHQVILSKTLADGITVVGQKITIALAQDDTVGYAGMHKWELNVGESTAPTTIGEGAFVINRRYNQ